MNETARHYDVQLIDYHWRLANLEDAMGIIVSSQITKQHEKVRKIISFILFKKLTKLNSAAVLYSTRKNCSLGRGNYMTSYH